MARNGVTKFDIAKAIGKSDKKVFESVKGLYAFTVYEAMTIRDTFFPGMTIEYLFANEEVSA
jgi:hypothetical protein